jgi:hypothetical protein
VRKQVACIVSERRVLAKCAQRGAVMRCFTENLQANGVVHRFDAIGGSIPLLMRANKAAPIDDAIVTNGATRVRFDP